MATNLTPVNDLTSRRESSPPGIHGIPYMNDIQPDPFDDSISMVSGFSLDQSYYGDQEAISEEPIQDAFKLIEPGGHGNLKLELNIKGRNITENDMASLMELLESWKTNIDIEVVDMKLSKFCGKSWDDHPKGIQNLERILRHPRLQPVKAMNLSQLKLPDIPRSISECHSHRLEKVDITSNKVGNFPEDTLHLEVVRELQLGFNQMTSLPDKFETPNLVKIGLEKNPIFEIPASLYGKISVKNYKRLEVHFSR